MELDFLINRIIPALNRGAWMSLQIILPSAVFGFLGGILIGVLRVFCGSIGRKIGDFYTALFRGVPLVIQLMVIYYGLARFGIFFTPYWAAVTSFVLCSSAYHSEYIRGALLSIRTGQVRAAQALGFSRMNLIVSIIIPQALRRALPGCGNEIIYLIKYSSLAYLITCIEMTGEAKLLASRSYHFTEVFMAVGLYYLIFTSLATWALHWVEKRTYIPGFGHKE